MEAGEEAVSLVGEARNVAVRLEDVAEPGQVVCTAATHRLIRGQFDCTSLGHRKIKGVAQPVELFQVQGVGEARSPIEAAGPAGLTPLTGRDHEISLLKDRWEQAQEGMGQVVLLIGEPGLGKSRLVYTLKEHVLGQMVEGEVDAPVIEWRCSPHYQNTRAVPGHRLLRAGPRLRPRGAAAGPVRPAAPPPGAVRPGPAGDRAAVGVAAVAADARTASPRSSLSPARQREETFRAMLEWLHTRAARRPVLFVVEDLHWVDASTLEFLGQFLAEGLHDSHPHPAHLPPRVPDALARGRPPDQPGPEPPDAAPGRRPDAEEDGGRRCRRRWSSRSTTGPAACRCSSKNSRRWCRSRACWTRQGKAARGPRPCSAREIPATLQDLVMARLDRMEGDREVAQLAAVLGREFSYELLAAVANVDEPTLQAELAKLVQAEILYPKGRPPRCTYIFKHALLEDALYNALVKGKRQQFHRRIAEVLEARFPQTAETQPELLAHHFTEAGLTEKAIGYWLKAGLRSRERSAEIEAIGHLTRAWRCWRRWTSRPSATRGNWNCSARWAPPTSRRAVTPRPKSARSSAGARAVRADRAAAAAVRASCWASGSGTSCAAISGCASDLAAEGMEFAEPARTTPAS